MNKATEIRYNPVYPSVIEIVAGPKTTLLSSETPMTDLMLNPEKVEAVLSTAPAENIPVPAPSKKKARGQARRDAKKKTKFFLKAVTAKSVKLAGDFTNWEKNPIEMVSSEADGWQTVVPLEPGQHAYRYIVDGQWHDDPACQRRVANDFGSENAVIEVI